MNPIEKMSGSEVLSRAESLSHYAESCREIGQGINSKETVQFRLCMERIEKEKLADPYTLISIKERWDPQLRPFHDLYLKLAEQGIDLNEMAKLFAPL